MPETENDLNNWIVPGDYILVHAGNTNWANKPASIGATATFRLRVSQYGADSNYLRQEIVGDDGTSGVTFVRYSKNVSNTRTWSEWGAIGGGSGYEDWTPSNGVALTIGTSYTFNPSGFDLDDFEYLTVGIGEDSNRIDETQMVPTEKITQQGWWRELCLDKEQLW